MSGAHVAAGPSARTVGAAWGRLLLSTAARFYLVFLAALAACALAPMLFGLTGSVVQSGSMEPHISVGDVVLSRPLAADAPTPMGRVITFHAPTGSALSGPAVHRLATAAQDGRRVTAGGVFILHRLVAANKDGTLVTAGDANPSPDSTPLSRQDIVSIACLLVPWIGLPSIWVRTGAYLYLGIWLLLTLGAVAVAAVEASSPRPPSEAPPDGTAAEAGSGPDPAPGDATPDAVPPSQSISALLSWSVPVVRVGAGSAAVALVAVFTAFALAVAPLGTAAAAFTARAASIGNSWAAAGPATRLAFTTDPSDSGATIAFDTQPVVVVLDALGHTVDVSNAPVTLALTDAAGATLTCTANPQRAVAGVATFAGCAVDDAGTYTLTATSGTLTSDVSAPFTITTGAATGLAFTTDPSSSTGGVAFATQPVVEVQDAGGNTVTTSTAPVTLSLTAAAGATLTCTANPVPAVAGVASFSGCRVDKPGTYSLTATSAGLASAISVDFTITTGPATRLAFTTDPSFSNAGVPFFTQPVVTVQDAGRNPVTTSTAPVTLSLTTPAGATLTCTANPKAAVAGVATFAGCKVDKAGTYTLTATATGLTSAVSASFTITVGTTTKLAFTTNPSSSTGGTAFATQPVVTIQDAGGNTVTSSTAPVTLVLTTPGSATLTCAQNPLPAVAGLATFTGCAVDKPGTYTLTAASTGLTSAVSTSFTITVGVAAKLAFTTSPSNTVVNTAFATQPVVTVQDAGGNTVTTSGPSVTLAITPPNGGALLTNCTANPQSTSSGVATFSGCRVSAAGTYTLTATSGTLTSAVSASFTISSSAVKLGFTRNPSTTTAAGATFGTQPRVATQNSSGQTINIGVTAITLTLTTPNGATLTCNANPVNTSSGVARFAGCKVNKPGVYTLTATATGLTSGVSRTFTITAVPSKLAFTTSPSGATGGTAFTNQPAVAIQDVNGTATTSTSTITLTLTTAAGATLTCTTNPKAATAGTATFTGCRIDRAGTYTLTATASGLTSAVSTSFTVAVGPATRLAFTTSPSSSTGGTAFTTQPVVTVQDAGGNTVTTSTASVDLRITTAGAATLTCTDDPKTAVSGVATFAGCRIDRSGTYSLTATSTGLTNAVSGTFTISVGPATRLAFTTQPSGAARNIAFAIQPFVTVQDAGGNTVTASGPSVTLAISPPTGGAVLTCTANPRTTSSGVAIFSGCRVNIAGTYTLTATSGTLTSATSNPFAIT